MTTIKTVSTDVIEIQFNCKGKTTYIYIKRIGSERRIDILRMHLMDLSISEAIEFNNVLMRAISISNEFDYSLEKFKIPQNADWT